jgi:trimethylamine--corrinoid protein Co-methyltransferase
MINLQPIEARLRLDVLDAGQLAEVKAATLHILEHVGVQFPSQRALSVFAAHGAQVDWESQVVRMSPDLVLEAMRHAPRNYVLAGRSEGTDLYLDGKRSYFGTDGCGTRVIDRETSQERRSTKADVGMMARVADYLSSVAFYWPMVSAWDCGKLAPLHELDASFNNTSKHVQTETVMGEKPAQYAVYMGEALAGGKAEMRARPPFSVLICTIAPLGQDDEGIEAGMVYAEAGVPVGFMSMPNMGATAPAAAGGALAVGDAEVVSAMVLMQLVAPGAPVFHALLASLMDPRSADYLTGVPEKVLCNAAAVQLAHAWGVPALAGAFGMDGEEPNTWKLGRDSLYTALMVALAGADTVVGLGMLDASTLLLPEQIIFDDEIYHMNRVMLQGLDTSAQGLALDVIQAVGPRGHFLSQEHTRQSVRKLWIPQLTHPRPSLDGSPVPDIREPQSNDIRQRARAQVDKILAEHKPEPLDEALQAELKAILDAAERELM